jgi:hypothetical protein
MASRSLLDLNPETRKRAELFVAKCATFGIGVFMALDGFGQPISLCAAGAGVGGHMAARPLFIVERIIEQKLKKAAG